MKEAAKGMDVITGNVGNMDGRGFKELTALFIMAISLKGKSVVDIDDDDFVDRTPLAKMLGRRHHPHLSPYTLISSIDISYTSNGIDETSIVYYTSLNTVDKGAQEMISTYIAQKGALFASVGMSHRHIIQIL